LPPASAAHAAHPRRPQLRALTGVRFLAAAHVVVFHCVDWPGFASPIARGLAGTGYVAVSLFFVLSGFILTYTYFGEGARTPPLRELYAGRFARIYPVYAVGLTLAAPFFAAKYVREGRIGELAVATLLVASLLQAWTPRFALAWNAPSWSLSAEAFFYALFPFLAPPLVRCRRGTAITMALVAWLATLGGAGLYLAFAPDGIASPTYQSDAFVLDGLRYAPPFRALDFVVGIVLGRLYLDEAIRPRVARWASPMATFAAVALIAVLAVAEHIPYVFLHSGLLTPLFAALIFGLAYGDGALARALARPAMVALGEASYALYVLHVPVLILVRKAATAALGPAFAASSAFTAVFFAIVVAASIACYQLVEVPARAKLRDALAGRRAAVARRA
jgi:peptidoglycan/LPS O-acetylase OafA/YrhL